MLNRAVLLELLEAREALEVSIAGIAALKRTGIWLKWRALSPRWNKPPPTKPRENELLRHVGEMLTKHLS